MKSRISIEVDFENENQPVIQVLSQDSDDVRDRLIKAFLQNLAHTSRWCKIIYMGNFGTYDMVREKAMPNECHKWVIVPIKPSEIPQEISLMKALAESIDK